MGDQSAGLAVVVDPRQHGHQLRILRQAGEGAPVRGDQVQGGVDDVGGVQRRDELIGPGDGHGELRRVLGAGIVHDLCEAAQPGGLPAAPQGGQVVQHLAAHGVDGGDGQGEPRLDDAAHLGADIGGPAGAGKTGGQHGIGDGAGHGLVGRRSLSLADMAVAVLHGQHAALTAVDDGIELHWHAGDVAPLEAGPGLGEKGLVGGLVGAGAEHIVAGLSAVITLGEALAGEGVAQIGELPPADPAAVEDAAVDFCGGGDILRPLHAALDLDGGDAHLLQVPEVLHQAVVLEAEGVF